MNKDIIALSGDIQSSDNIKVVLIGSGNVATHLGERLLNCGIQISQVYSRTLINATILAQKLNTHSIDNFNQIDTSATIYILAIKDGAIASVAQQLEPLLPTTAILAHTSGATPSTVFQPFFKNYGVFYPLQTFSKSRTANFETLPMCIDGSSDFIKKQLLDLAQIICPNVYQINDTQRSILHVAAVFVNNFTNHLLAIGEDIAQQEQLPFELLKPLIHETVAKIEEHSAKSMQTGPAIRNDQQTIERHNTFLDQYPNYQLLYKLLSKSIQDLNK